MDQLDIAIIEFLQRDARTPLTDIAKAIGVVEGTVRNRVARLQEKQILHLNGTIDPHQAGFKALAYIFVSVKPGSLEAVASQLTEIPEVCYLAVMTGEADLLIKIMCLNTEHLVDVLFEKIHSIDDITNTHTANVMRVYKEHMPDVSLIHDMPENPT